MLIKFAILCDGIKNKTTGPEFSYRDLRTLLETIFDQHCGSAFNINLGWGSVLHNVVDHSCKYFYVSTNNLLFVAAKTIPTAKKLNDLIGHIEVLDLIENYYLKKPASSYVLAGLPNIETWVYPLECVSIGVGIEVPDHINKFRAIRGLTHDMSIIIHRSRINIVSGVV